MLDSLKHLLIAFMIGLILCPPSMVYAAGITPDGAAPVANQATMDAAQNGVPVVNIAAPTGSGMSHNMFTDFNVGAEGVIINNGIAPGISQLGGALAPNANLGGNAASTILNEVTGNGRSSLLGYTEIFGVSANYILANPNGISINGGGFINTPKATLSTGTPQFTGNTFNGLDVTKGDILIEGAGINTNNIDAFELVTRVAQINADIYAKQLNIITGQNRYVPSTGATTPLTPDGSPVPTISIDSTALGGMYAGRIKLVGTEAGVGVNTLGIVQSTEHLEMTADGKIQIRNTVSSAQTLAITSTNDAVEVSGMVNAVDSATLTGQTVTVAKVDPADSPVVYADKVVINAGTLTNEEFIAAGSEAIVSATNLTNTGTIYSGGTGTFRIGDTLHNDQSIIRAKGDMVLEGAIAGQKMGTLQNDSAEIESINGSLTFRASIFNNNNSQFVLTEGATAISMDEGVMWWYGDLTSQAYRLFREYIGDTPAGGIKKTIMMIYPDQVAVLDLATDRNVYSRDEVRAAITQVNAELALNSNYLSAAERTQFNRIANYANNSQYVYFGRTVGRTDGFAYRATATRDTATGEELGGTIAAQGNIFIEADDAKNIVSNISSATGDITINANTFENVGKEIYERLTIKYGRGIFHGQQSPNYYATGGGTEVHLTPIKYAYGTIDAGNKVIISSEAVANGVTERDGIHNLPDPATQQQKLDNITSIIDAFPTKGLVKLNTDPSHPYLLETDPRFVDMDSFLGSDYLIERLGLDPAEMGKRVGDKAVEAKLVRQQIMDLAGRRFLDEGFASDTDQMQALMDNAVQAQSDLQLSIGISLSSEQVAALTNDIIWMETKVVLGQEVLVPVVYLGTASLAKIAQGGSVIMGKEVIINTTGDVTNAGLIQAQNQVVITAENFFNLKGTVSGETVTATAVDSIRNTGGAIQGTNIALKAGNDVVTSAATVQGSSKHSSYTMIAKAGKISATDSLSIEAGRNIGILGSDVEGGGDTTLKAGENVAISTVETTFKSKNSGSGFNTHTDSTYNKSSTLKTGGALIVEAGKDVAIHGSQVEAGGDVDIKAGSNVSVTAATDKLDFYSHNSGSSGGFFGGSKSTTIDIKEARNTKSSLKAGGSLTAEAGLAGVGDIAIVGSKVESASDMSLKAQDGILISSAQEERYSFHDSKSSSLVSSKQQTSMAASTTQVGSEVIAGNDLTAEAKNVAVSASTVHAENNVSIKSTESDVIVTGAQDTASGYRYEKKSGVNLMAPVELLASASTAHALLAVEFTSSEMAQSKNTSSLNSGSQISAGNNVEIDSARDAAVIGSTIAAGNDVTINAVRDTNLIPGLNAQTSEQKKKSTSHGTSAFAVSENEISTFSGITIKETGSKFTGEYNAKSLVSAGNDVAINAGNNINQSSSDIEAGRDVKLKAGNDINVNANKDIEHSEQYAKEIRIGVTAAAKQSVSTAVRTLADMPKNMGSGEGGGAAKGLTAASEFLRGVSALQRVSSPGASVSITGGVSMEQSSSTMDASDAVTSSIRAGRDAELDADRDVVIEGAQVVAENDVTIKAGRDVEIKSATNKYSTGADSSSASAGGGIGASAGSGGVSLGIRVEGAAAGSEDESKATTHTNAVVIAKETLTIESGQDTTVAGANLEGKKVAMNVGRDLTVKSEQDKRSAAGSNWNVGGAVTIGYGASVEASASLGIGKSEADSAWVNKQTSIIGKEEVDILVDKNTHIEGAVIAAENGNLKLDTETLTYIDILDHDKAENFQVSLSASYAKAGKEEGGGKQETTADGTPVSKTLDASYSSKDREQINRATIGEGEIIIRSDPDAGLEGLNRDLERAQEITKDDKTKVTLYLDSKAISAIAAELVGREPEGATELTDEQKKDHGAELELSSCSYGDACEMPAGYEEVTAEALDKAGSRIKLDKLVDPDSGLHVSLYLNKESGKLIVACRGTDGLNDMVSSVAQAFGLVGQQYEISTEQLKNIQDYAKANDAKVIATGHSLGGGLATAMASTRFVDKAIVFNPAGLHANTVTHLEGSMADAQSKTTAYISNTDILNIIQDRMDALPDAVGKRVIVSGGGLHGIDGMKEAFKLN